MDRAELLERLAEAEGRLTFNPGNHTYRLDKKHIPGVTTILRQQHKEQLVRWMVRVQQEADIATAWRLAQSFGDAEFWSGLDTPANFAAAFVEMAGEEYEHQKQAREAADVGKQMHALMEHHFKAQLGLPTTAPEASDDAQAMFSSVLEFLRSGDLEPLSMERRLFNVADWYAGTVDLFALYQGKQVIPDYKGRKSEDANQLWPEQRRQSAAYRTAAKSMGLGEWGGLILAVPRDGGKVTPVPVTSDVEADMAAFRACQVLYFDALGKPRKKAEAA